MSRFVQLASEPLLESNEVVVELPHAAVPTLALELSLLLGEEADSVRLGATFGGSVVLTVGGGDAVSEAKVRRELNTVYFELGKNQAEYLQAVLLRAYRDGAAEVNHVHIEGAGGSEFFDLTLLFELYREPMSAEEAMKLMDR